MDVNVVVPYRDAQENQATLDGLIKMIFKSSFLVNDVLESISRLHANGTQVVAKWQSYVRIEKQQAATKQIRPTSAWKFTMSPPGVGSVGTQSMLQTSLFELAEDKQYVSPTWNTAYETLTIAEVIKLVQEHRRDTQNEASNCMLYWLTEITGSSRYMAFKPVLAQVKRSAMSVHLRLVFQVNKHLYFELYQSRPADGLQEQGQQT